MQKASDEFTARVIDQGGRVLGLYQGNKVPVHVQCRNGHDVHPRPNNVQSGQGLCRVCPVVHTALYVVHGSHGVKVGVTSGDGRTRLRFHKPGFPCVDRLWTDLPIGVADAAESALKQALANSGVMPVDGFEYFHPEALNKILNVVDGLLANN